VQVAALWSTFFSKVAETIYYSRLWNDDLFALNGRDQPFEARFS
jgi:hypothetical protein